MRFCSTIYIDRRYLNRLRNIKSSSVESSSIDTRLDRSQYSDNIYLHFAIIFCYLFKNLLICNSCCSFLFIVSK